MSTYKGLDSVDRSILQFLQDQLPINPSPYRDLSVQLGVQEEEIVERIQNFISKGIIKRIGAIPYHHSIGYSHNALVVWDIHLPFAPFVTTTIADLSFVSHCYFRKCPPQFPYPLFTMIHGTSEQDLIAKIQTLSESFQCKHYQILKSIKEWKKTSMKYTFTKEGE